MTDKGKDIIVKHWKEDRYENNLYKVDIKVDLSKVIISDSEIKDITKYTIAPNEYYIDNIKSEGTIYLYDCNKPTTFCLWFSYWLYNKVTRLGYYIKFWEQLTT